MKLIPEIRKVLKDKNFRKTVVVYFSTKAAGDDYDPYENNAEFTNLNPVAITDAYVRTLDPEKAFYKQYGLHLSDSKEIICEARYQSYFEHCNKIEIDGNTYQVFKSGTGNNTLISPRPGGLIRVVVTRRD